MPEARGAKGGGAELEDEGGEDLRGLLREPARRVGVLAGGEALEEAADATT